MVIVARVLSLCLLLVAAVASLGNAVLVLPYAQRRHDARSVSLIPLIAPVAAVLALGVSSLAPGRWLPAWSFWVVALSDIALWLLAGWGVRWLWRTMRARHA